jgi:hypothetical protein
MRCSNGKYKYGEHGNCNFDTLAKCQEAEQAIHAREGAKDYGHPVNCECPGCMGYSASDAYNPELDRASHYN